MSNLSQIPFELYEKRIQRYKNRGNWFVYFSCYEWIMPRLDSLFIQDLENLLNIPNINTLVINNEVYYQCTSEFLLNSRSRWSIKEQRIRLKSLSKLKFIKIVKKGIPASRFININSERIEAQLDAIQSSPNGPIQSSPLGPHWSSPNGPVKKSSNTTPTKEEHTLSRTRFARLDGEDLNIKKKGKVKSTKKRKQLNPVLPVQQLDKGEAFKLSSELYKILFKKRKICREPNLKSWAKELKFLLSQYSFLEIQEVMSYHSEHLDDRYWPKLYSAKSFVEGFPKIMDAIVRLSSQTTSKDEIIS